MPEWKAMVHCCPRCELRFETAVELADHLDVDHDAVEIAETFRRHHEEGLHHPPPRHD